MLKATSKASHDVPEVDIFGKFAGNQPFILGVKQWMPVDLPFDFDDDDDDDGASKQDLLDLDSDHVPHFSCLPPGTPPIPKTTNTNGLIRKVSRWP